MKLIRPILFLLVGAVLGSGASWFAMRQRTGSHDLNISRSSLTMTHFHGYDSGLFGLVAHELQERVAEHVGEDRARAYYAIPFPGIGGFDLVVCSAQDAPPLDDAFFHELLDFAHHRLDFYTKKFAEAAEPK